MPYRSDRSFHGLSFTVFFVVPLCCFFFGAHEKREKKKSWTMCKEKEENFIWERKCGASRNSNCGAHIRYTREKKIYTKGSITSCCDGWRNVNCHTLYLLTLIPSGFSPSFTDRKAIFSCSLSKEYWIVICIYWSRKKCEVKTVTRRRKFLVFLFFFCVMKLERCEALFADEKINNKVPHDNSILLCTFFGE